MYITLLSLLVEKSNVTGVLIIHVPLPYDSLWLRIIGVDSLGLD